MVKIWGKIIKNQKVVKSETFTSQKQDMSDALLEAIGHYTRAFDMEAPMWQSTHTKQLGLFRRATFKADDFIDRIDFDRFELQILDAD